MATTQDRRSIQLSTPLAKDFLLIKRMRCREGLNQLFRIEVEMLHEEETDGFMPTVVDPKKLLGNPMIISAHQAGPIERFFHGVCINFTQGSRNARFSKYRAELVPKVWMLTQISQSRIFQNKTVPQILEEVLDGYEFDNEIKGIDKPRNYCVQYRESDWDFASRIMEEEGIFYYFEHTKDSHRLILANTPPSHRPCPSESNITFALERSELADQWIPAIHSWRIDNKMLTGKYELRDFHFQLPTNDLLATQNSLFDIGKNRDLEHYDWPGGYAKRFDAIDPGGTENTARLNPIFDDRERTVKIRQEELDVAYKSIYGTADCCSMTAGYKFDLKDHPVKENNISHVLVNVQHEAVQSPSYISDDSVSNAYMVNFVCIPHGGGFAPFRPLRKTPKPVVHGSQTAKVVGNPDDEIFTDKYGRVKVHFHWDRSDNNDQKASAWIRVGNLFAGNKWGSMFTPRVGHEVIVDFLEGDPDQPIIVGSVYNAENMPHYELPKYKTLSYIKTHSTPKAKGFNELRFEDKKDKEQVFIHSERRMDVRVKASLYETCGGNRQEVIGMRTDNYPGGNLAVSVGGDHDLHVKYDERITVDKKRYEIVTGDVFEGYEGKKVTLITGKSEQNAEEIILEANTKISLKVGASCVVIEPALITIAAQMVKINSGGFGTETSDPDIACAMDAEYSDNGEPGYLDRPRTGGGKKGPVWRKFKSKHHAYPPRKDEDPAMRAIRAKLQKTPSGRHALEVYERYGVKSTFNTGTGGGYQGGSLNSMNLDPAWGDYNNTAFAHEMYHAQMENEKTTADIMNQSREDYVDTMMREEAAAKARAIQTEEELAAAGEPQTSLSRRYSYDAGYAKGRADALAANPNATEAELEAAGRKAGEESLVNDYKTNKITPSNINGVVQPPYPEYYGKEWDKKHPKTP
jgi:type VI secretion system secreted protein VgrG